MWVSNNSLRKLVSGQKEVFVRLRVVSEECLRKFLMRTNGSFLPGLEEHYSRLEGGFNQTE